MNKEYLLKAARDSIKIHVKTRTIPLGHVKRYAKKVMDINNAYNEHIPQSEIDNLIAEYPELSSNITKQLNQETLNSEKEALLELQKLIESSDQ